MLPRNKCLEFYVTESMANKTKTWKIGEYAKGGIITVEISKTEIAIIGKDWDFSTGSRKSSDQSNAKEFDRETVSLDSSVESHKKVSEFLHDLTTSYYAEKIMDWIAQNSTFKKHMFW